MARVDLPDPAPTSARLSAQPKERRTSPPDNANLLLGLDLERDVLQNRRQRRRVAHDEVLDDDPALI